MSEIYRVILMDHVWRSDDDQTYSDMDTIEVHTQNGDVIIRRYGSEEELIFSGYEWNEIVKFIQSEQDSEEATEKEGENA